MIGCILLFLISGALWGSDLPNPQYLMEKWDNFLINREGVGEWIIGEEHPPGRESKFIQYSGDNGDILFVFIDNRGFPETKYFVRKESRYYRYKKRTESITHSLSLQEATLLNIPRTSLSFFDLIGLSIEKNFIASDLKTYNGKEKKYYKLEIKPIFESYSKLVIYLEIDTLKPYRMDLYDKSGLLLKIIRYYFGMVVLQDKNESRSIEILNKIESTDMQNSKKSYIQLKKITIYPQIPSAIFSDKGLQF